MANLIGEMANGDEPIIFSGTLFFRQTYIHPKNQMWFSIFKGFHLQKNPWIFTQKTAELWVAQDAELQEKRQAEQQALEALDAKDAQLDRGETQHAAMNGRAQRGEKWMAFEALPGEKWRIFEYGRVVHR